MRNDHERLLQLAYLLITIQATSKSVRARTALSLAQASNTFCCLSVSRAVGRSEGVGLVFVLVNVSPVK
jgi:hypothetical protein